MNCYFIQGGQNQVYKRKLAVTVFKTITTARVYYCALTTNEQLNDHRREESYEPPYIPTSNRVPEIQNVGFIPIPIWNTIRAKN